MAKRNWQSKEDSEGGNGSKGDNQPKWDAVDIAMLNHIITNRGLRREFIVDMCQGIVLFLNTPKVVLECILSTEQAEAFNIEDVNKPRWEKRIKFLIDNKEILNKLFKDSEFGVITRD